MSLKAQVIGKSKTIVRNRDIGGVILPQTPELLADLKSRVALHLEMALDGTTYFVVDIQWSGDSRKLLVRVDGDKGVNIDICSALNQSLGKLIDEHEWQGSVVIEVGSPGAEAPLVMVRQYPQHVGRLMKIFLFDGSVLMGSLLRVEGSGVALMSQDGLETKLNFNEFKEAKVVIV